MLGMGKKHNTCLFNVSSHSRGRYWLDSLMVDLAKKKRSLLSYCRSYLEGIKALANLWVNKKAPFCPWIREKRCTVVIGTGTNPGLSLSSRFMPLAVTTCASLAGSLRWSGRVAQGHCGEGMASMCWRLHPSQPSSSWPMSRWDKGDCRRTSWKENGGWGKSWSLNVCLFWLLQIKRFIGTDQEMLRIHERLLAGSLAGAIAQSSIYPMEVRQEAESPAQEDSWGGAGMGRYR